MILDIYLFILCCQSGHTHSKNILPGPGVLHRADSLLAPSLCCSATVSYCSFAILRVPLNSWGINNPCVSVGAESVFSTTLPAFHPTAFCTLYYTTLSSYMTALAPNTHLSQWNCQNNNKKASYLFTLKQLCHFLTRSYLERFHFTEEYFIWK